MKTLVKYRAACHFESDGIAVRQGDELLCLGPRYVRDTNERADNRLFRCLLYRDGSQDLFVDVYPGEAEEASASADRQAINLSLSQYINQARAAIMRSETRFSFDSQ